MKEIQQTVVTNLEREIKDHLRKAAGLSAHLRAGIGKIPGGGYSERQLFKQAFKHKVSGLCMSEYLRGIPT